MARAVLLWALASAARAESFRASDDTIHDAVDLWVSNRAEALTQYGHISDWDTGDVTDMSGLFCNEDGWHLYCRENSDLELFNDDISAWDTSNVRIMRHTFARALEFNQPLNSWDVSKVRDMNSLFRNARAFDQPLDSWNVARVKMMNDIFGQTFRFDQNIGSWDVSNVKTMSFAFYKAKKFNSPIDSWDVSRVTDTSYMFSEAKKFNQPLASWDVSAVRDMTGMFRRTVVFDQPLDSWDVSSVKGMAWMFTYSDVFNQDLSSWDVSRVEDVAYMFNSCDSFDQDLGWCLDDDIRRYSVFNGVPCASANCGVTFASDCDGGGGCGDDASWYYKKASKDCQWVSEKSKRCKLKNEAKVKAKKACEKSCGAC